MNREILKLLGYAMSSFYRREVLLLLKGLMKIPSQISRELSQRNSQVSKALGELKRKNIVVCINESAHKWRVYKTTELGDQIIELIERYGLRDIPINNIHKY